MNSIKRSKRNNSEGVNVLMRPEVMCFDMMPVTCFSYTRLLYHPFNICFEVRIIDDPSKIALEVDNIDQIKSNERGE